MPAKSKQQQKFFGVVKSMQSGDLPKKGAAGKAAKDMSKKEVDKYAGTKHKGLPKKVKKETMKISDIKKMVQEEIQALNEVKPFVDNRMRNQYDYPKGNRDGIVYLATNDKRYPTEIVLYNQKRDVFHFVYSHDGNFKPGSTKQQTVPRKGFNSTHYVMPYFEEWEEDLGYERGFYEGKVNEADRTSSISKQRAKAELKQQLKGKRSDGLGDYTAIVYGMDGNNRVPLKSMNDINKYSKFEIGDNEHALKEVKMTPAKVQKAQKELVATIQLLKKNFPMYKAAKDSGDEKKLAKHRDIALKLTKKKKQLELDLDRALGGLYQDAELDLKEGKVKPVTKQMWDKMDDDARVNALLTAFKDPDDAEEHAESEYDDLPPVATSNMVIYEAAPRMQKDPYVEKLRLLYKEIAKLDNQMKAADSSRYSHVKRDFNKALKGVAELTNTLNRKGATIPEGKLNEDVYDDILRVIPDNYSYKNLAQDIADVIKDAYGSHNIKPFMREIGRALKEGKLNEALPKFKTPVEALKWIWSKRDEAMDMEQQLKDISSEIQMTISDMEQEAEPGGGPKADKYGRELEALENQHKDLRASYDMVMAEIDEMEQNYIGF